jgi:UDPglucose--hexose-1-phosphate uridylyltransferase
VTDRVAAPRTTLTQPDGRHVHLYGAHRQAPEGYVAPLISEGIAQRRWHPLRQEWVLVSAARQTRTFLPDLAQCPLCPSLPGHSSEIPASAFELAVFDNRFPAMRDRGCCEVVVYTDQHEGTLGTLPPKRVSDLVDVWADRYRELSQRPDVRYVFIFENRGEAVGVTLPHPHGQIYAYPFIPPVVRRELDAGRRYAARGKGCLLCALVLAEVQAGQRLLISDGGIVAYVPAYARWPYEVHVAPEDHRSSLTDLSPSARAALAGILQRVSRAYDRLFDRPMPYMMAVHQRPTDGRRYPQAHLRVEFYPTLRDAGKLKYLAAGECGAGTFVAEGMPEERAASLRTLM